MSIRWSYFVFPFFMMLHSAEAKKPIDPLKTSVKDLCSIKDSIIRRATTLEDLRLAVCQVQDRFPDQASIRAKGEDVLTVLRKLNAPDPDGFPSLGNVYLEMEEEELDQSLDAFAVALREQQPRKNFESSSTHPVALALKDLDKKYGTSEARWADPQGYMKAMTDVLAKTVTGKKAIECFYKKDNPKIRQSVFKFKKKEDPGSSSAAATFGLEPTSEDPTVYDKVATMGLELSPFENLPFLAHEMQHACDTPDFYSLMEEIRVLNSSGKDLESRYRAKYKEVYKKDYSPDQVVDGISDLTGEVTETLPPGATPPPPTVEKDANGQPVDPVKKKELEAIEAEFGTLNQKIEQISLKNDPKRALSELKAYQMTPLIFKELAVHDPVLFCQNYYKSGMMNKKVVTTADYMRTIETEVANGTFLHTLVPEYVGLGGYEMRAFFSFDENQFDFKRDPQTGLYEVLPSVKAQLKKAGFNVKP